MVKLAFFWSYKRVFSPSKTLRWLCYGGAFVCTCLYVAEIFHDIFICIPVQKDWDPRLPGQCLPSGVAGSVTAIFNVITDLYILILPLPFLWSLQMALHKKIRLMILFGIGALYENPTFHYLDNLGAPSRVALVDANLVDRKFQCQCLQHHPLDYYLPSRQ